MKKETAEKLALDVCSDILFIIILHICNYNLIRNYNFICFSNISFIIILQYFPHSYKI